jgi:sulfite dehydrogenase (cytochrome) subunit B
MINTKERKTRTSMRFALAIAVTGALFSPLALKAEPRTYALPQTVPSLLPGPNMEAAAPCTGCHSPDYIKTQPPRQGKAFWTAIVNKMRKVFGAPVEEDDVAKIVEYLSATY